MNSCKFCGGTIGFHLSSCTKPLTEEELRIQKYVYQTAFSLPKNANHPLTLPARKD